MSQTQSERADGQGEQGEPTGPAAEATELGQTELGQTEVGPAEVLTDDVPPARPGRSRKGLIAASVTALAVAGVAAGGYAAYGALSGGGDQPEQHLPASTVAMVKIDLDPAVNQKLDAVRFAAKFPGSGLREGGDPREWLWSRLAEQVPGAAPWAQATNWLGDRAAVAVLPPAAGGKEPQVVLAIEVSDDAKALADMQPVTEDGVAVRDGWLYVTDDVKGAEAVAGAAQASPLSADPTFTADLARLGEDGIAAAWINGDKVGSVLPEDAAAQWRSATATIPGFAVGHGAFALRFSGSSLELAGSVIGAAEPAAAGGVGTGVEALPASSLAGIGVAGLGPTVAANWEAGKTAYAKATGGDPEADIATLEGLFGNIDLPADLETLLGTKFALVADKPVGGQPAIGMRVVTDPAKAGPLTQRLLAPLAGPDAPVAISTSVFDSGYTVASSDEYAKTLTAAGTLGAEPGFQAVVPDAATANTVVYADLAGLLAAYKDLVPAEDLKSLEPLAAFGMTSSSIGDTQSVRLRLTTK